MTRSLKRVGPTGWTNACRLTNGRASCSRSRSLSTKCSTGWRIRLPGSRNSPPISRMNCARPIANIRGEAEVALTRPRSPNEYQAVIESSIAECERLCGIIDNLLFLARAEAAESKVNYADFRRAAPRSQKSPPTTKRSRRNAGSGLSAAAKAKIDADPVLFGRAVSNLVENACALHRGRGPDRDLDRDERRRAGDRRCEDNGCGIGEETFRVSSTAFIGSIRRAARRAPGWAWPW